MSSQNKTSADAFHRVMEARIGSLVDPTEEYLDKLELEVAKWLQQIKEERFERFNARTSG